MDQKVQRNWKDDLVSEVASSQKESHGEKKKRHNKAFLMPVKPRRDKAPDLVQDHRRSQKNASHQSNLQIQIEWICRTEVGQMGIHVVFLEYNQDWLLNKRVNFVLGKIPANPETYGHSRQGTDNAFAQLFQMLQPAHLVHMTFYF